MSFTDGSVFSNFYHMVISLIEGIVLSWTTYLTPANISSIPFWYRVSEVQTYISQRVLGFYLYVRIKSGVWGIWASLVAQMVKNLPAVQKNQVQSWVRKIRWRREWLPTPVFLPGEFHGQRSLGSYTPWGHKELDTTEHLKLSHFMWNLIFLIWLKFFLKIKK